MRMRAFILLSLLFLCNGLSIAQMSFDITSYDFGDLDAYSNRFIDVTITNKGPKAGYVLSVRKPMEVVYIQNKSLIEQNSSLTIRFQVNPKKKGRFVYEIPVYTSDKDDPTIIKLKGNLEELPSSTGSGLTSCPDFGSHPAGKKPNAFDLTVITIDKDTRTELSESRVTFVQNGTPIWIESTNKKGRITKEADLGLSYFYAVHDGYFPAEIGQYVNAQRNVVVLELERKDQEVIAVVEPPVEVVEEPEVIVEEPVEIEIEVNPTPEVVIEEDPTPIAEEVPPALDELDEANFDSDLFVPINVVFVLDISSSMNQSDKIELMKYSLMRLTDMLRPEDRIGIVTYSNNAQVLLEPTSGADKTKIKDEVKSLKASGMTAGGAGIKLGYKTAYKSLIPSGVNQVIIITDGDFNRDSKDYKKAIKKYKHKGINFSVVGVKNKERDEETMRDAAHLGGGTYIPIFKLADAQRNLNQAVRILTFRP